jgi:GDP/GTP exchange factor required for growth at low temperature
MARWKRALTTRPASTAASVPAAKVSAFDLDLLIDAPSSNQLTTRPAAARPTLAPVAVKFQSTFTDSNHASPVEPPAVPPKDVSGLHPVVEDAEEEERGPQPDIGGVEANDDIPEPVVEPAEELVEPAEPEADVEPEPESPPSSAPPTLYNQHTQRPTFDDAPSYRSSLASSRFSYHSQGSDDYYAAPPVASGSTSLERPSNTSNPSWRRLQASNDVDFSDYSDSDEEQPAAVSKKLKQAKRMPRRGEFELVRRSESFSSFGEPERSSVASTSSVERSQDKFLEPIALQGWHLEAMADDLSDGEASGDRDAALRRIEGQVDPNYERAKNHKAEGWVQQIREQQAAGITWHTSRGGGGHDSDDEDYGEQQESTLLNADPDTVPSDTEDSGDANDANELLVPSADFDGDAATPLAERPPTMQSGTTLVSSSSGSETKPSVDGSVASDMLGSRAHLPPQSPALTSGHTSPPIKSPLLKKVALPGRMTYRRSFVLDFPSLVLAEHFSMIDRELFLAIKFEELTMESLLHMSEEANVLDWSQFLKERVAAKAQGAYSPITASLIAVRARFNLLASFVTSEILVAHPQDRAHVHSKFLRIAWVSLTSVSKCNSNVLMLFLESAADQQLRDSCRSHARPPEQVGRTCDAAALPASTGLR